MAKAPHSWLSIVDNDSRFLESWASKCLERSMKIKDIRASLHGFSISIPLLEGRVQGYGREEQTHFVFCEVETDEGHVGYGLTGPSLPTSVTVALHAPVRPVVSELDPRDLDAIPHNAWKTLNSRPNNG